MGSAMLLAFLVGVLQRYEGRVIRFVLPRHPDRLNQCYCKNVLFLIETIYINSTITEAAFCSSVPIKFKIEFAVGTSESHDYACHFFLLFEVFFLLIIYGILFVFFQKIIIKLDPSIKLRLFHNPSRSLRTLWHSL